MSDRVAIIGGSTVGRDHFPFAVSDYVAPPDSPSEYFPISLSLSKAAKWFYRVKKWSLVIHAELDVETDVFEYTEDPDPDLVTNTYTGYATWDMSAEATMLYNEGAGVLEVDREAKLVLPVSVGSLTLSPLVGELLWDDSSTSPIDANGGLTMFDPSGPGLRFSIGLLYPYIYVEFYLSTTCRPDNTGPFSGIYGGGSEAILFLVGTKALLPTGDSITPGIVIDGENVPTFHDLSHDDVTEITPRIELSNPELEITMTPIEYWPYATTAGLPVYDTSTGEQINDPLS